MTNDTNNSYSSVLKFLDSSQFLYITTLDFRSNSQDVIQTAKVMQ